MSSEAAPIHALSSTQERHLVNYLDERFLEITGDYRKRSQPAVSKLSTLAAYLEATQQLLSFILQIPPVDPSTSLRTTFLLRLTGDVMNSIPGYPPDSNTLPNLLDFLDDLDQAWLTVLQNQIWDPLLKEAVDLVIPAQQLSSNSKIHSTPMSQTERTRLRSLLVTGTSQLEEWLASMSTGSEALHEAFERMGLQQAFDDLFSMTMAELGGLSGPLNDPHGMEGTC